MTDRYGALPVPDLPAGIAGRAVTDPLLDYTLGYLGSVLNKHADTAWRSVFKASPPVKATFAHDPEQHCFSTSDLPALYLWRGAGGEFERLAEDWHVKHSVLTLLWVFPAAVQFPQHHRRPFLNGLLSVVHTAIETGRDPAWVVPGDPDPTAAARGSVWPRWAGFLSLRVGKWKASQLVIAEGSKRLPFDAVEAEIPVTEHWAYDLAAHGEPNLGGELATRSEGDLPLGGTRLP
jgi:hypothetical protein